MTKLGPSHVKSVSQTKNKKHVVPITVSEPPDPIIRRKLSDPSTNKELSDPEKKSELDDFKHTPEMENNLLKQILKNEQAGIEPVAPEAETNTKKAPVNSSDPTTLFNLCLRFYEKRPGFVMIFVTILLIMRYLDFDMINLFLMMLLTCSSAKRFHVLYILQFCVTTPMCDWKSKFSWPVKPKNKGKHKRIIETVELSNTDGFIASTNLLVEQKMSTSGNFCKKVSVKPIFFVSKKPP